jgi:PKD domain
VLDKKDTLQPLPAIHASFYPTFGIKPGDPVTFQVRSFNIDVGGETWDFGDGSPEVEVESKPGYLWFHSQYDGVDIKTNEHEKMGYAQTTHSFAEPGDYLVRVENTNKKGYKAVTCLHVRVEL